MPAAAVCGSKRSTCFFEDEFQSPVSKKLRFYGTTTPSSSPSPFHQLKSLFPHTDPQLLDRALEECGNDLNYAIKSLHEHCLGSAEHGSTFAEEVDGDIDQGTLTNNEDAAASENPPAPSNLPADGVEWVDFFMREMMSATSVDDAKSRASRVLKIFEKSIDARAAAVSAESFQKENMILKEKIEVVIQENNILKKAVAIQHERQKEFDDKNRELQHLKQLVSQYQEQLRTLEVNNYALMMHLRRAHESSHIPGRLHPDVF